MHFETNKGVYINTDKPADPEPPSEPDGKISAEIIAVICVVSGIAIIAVGIVVYQKNTMITKSNHFQIWRDFCIHGRGVEDRGWHNEKKIIKNPPQKNEK